MYQSNHDTEMCGLIACPNWEQCFFGDEGAQDINACEARRRYLEAIESQAPIHKQVVVFSSIED